MFPLAVVRVSGWDDALTVVVDSGKDVPLTVVVFEKDATYSGGSQWEGRSSSGGGS